MKCEFFFFKIVLLAFNTHIPVSLFEAPLKLFFFFIWCETAPSYFLTIEINFQFKKQEQVSCLESIEGVALVKSCVLSNISVQKVTKLTSYIF